ncbi:MAG: ABC transporter ATP-binding protein [Phycisphaerae bacterium]
MLQIVWPHRAAMAWGVGLGLGVALTYAASLTGLLPVLKVVVGNESVQDWLVARGEKLGGFVGSLLFWLAQWTPAGNSADARMRTLFILLTVLLGLNILGNALRCVSQYLVLYASNRAIMDVRRRMYRKSLHVPMTDVTQDHSARVSQFLSDVREVLMGITTLFGKVAREPLKAICVLSVALALDWRLTLIVLAIVPVAVAVLWYFGRKVRKATVRLLAGYGLMLGALEESLQGIDTVKGYAQERRERRRMWQLERKMLTQQNRLAWIEAFSSPLIEVSGVLIASAGVVWLASRTFRGEIDPPHFMTMVVLLSAMLDPIRKIANVYNVVQRAGAATDRIFAFLQQPEERIHSRAAAPPVRGARAIEFTDVSFRYGASSAVARDQSRDRERARDAEGPAFSQPRLPYARGSDRGQPGVDGATGLALAGVSLSVRPGECIAIVGPNGSGKSTLMKLLPRLLEPQQGSITIDGIDVRRISLRALREEIAIVSQRPAIFARTTAENISYGAPGAGSQEIRQAARRAFAAEFIEQWPKQYETVLGEFGASISGGQRQRIAIARAFLKPASVLIFDEATSEIDAESEQKIHAALRELRQGKTTFLIAHRHTVMEMADRLVVMDAGRIIAVGTHVELLARCPLYVALYRSPAAG